MPDRVIRDCMLVLLDILANLTPIYLFTLVIIALVIGG